MKLLATDLDGTIVRKDGTISERVRKALAACQDAGIHLCVATGRVRQGALQIGQDYTICHGGTIVMQGDRHLYRTTLTAEQAAETWRWAMAQEMPAVFFADDRWSATYADEQTAALARFLGCEPAGEPAWEVPLARFRCPAAALATAFPDLHVEQEGDWSYLRRTAADKGTALLALMEILGLSPDEVICFGDELNDLSMFAVAGQRVAVENARPELKAMATRIAPSVDDDGVAVVLEELLG